MHVHCHLAHRLKLQNTCCQIPASSNRSFRAFCSKCQLKQNEQELSPLAPGGLPVFLALLTVLSKPWPFLATCSAMISSAQSSSPLGVRLKHLKAFGVQPKDWPKPWPKVGHAFQKVFFLGVSPDHWTFCVGDGQQAPARHPLHRSPHSVPANNPEGWAN